MLSCVVTLLLACAPKNDTSTDTDGGSSTEGSGSETATPTSSGGSESTGAPSEDCAFLVGKKFLSDELLECGLGPDGVETCPWQISFTEDIFSHLFSDYGEEGTYTCNDGQIMGLVGNQPRVGTIDAALGELVWEDIVYHVAP